MNYQAILSYLYACLPMYQRIGAAAYKADLKNTLAICKMLGNPEKKFPSVHIAGTNGKGSVAHLLAAVLQCAGYKTGLYTSPHLKDFRERIRVNGKMIPRKYVMDFVRKYKMKFEKISPSFFEWASALAFDYFAKEKVDVAVIETGMGGRLDSTNVITPLLSIITNISYDHQNFLGNTLKKIAFEKAGIIKKNGIIIIGEKQKNVHKVFVKKADDEKALLLVAEEYIPRVNGIECGLKGNYQKKNIPSVLLAAEILCHLGFSIFPKAVHEGLKNVCRLTGLKGRWQAISKNPLIIADVAHNEAGIKEVFGQVKKVPYKKLHVVLGTVNDKDLNKILPLLPVTASYYFCKAKIPRALDENILAAKAYHFGLRGKTFPSVKKAFAEAKKNASEKDFIIVTGSTFVVAEIL